MTSISETAKQERIYRSPYPSIPLPRQSVWSFCFDAREHDPAIPAYIDAPTGRTLSRADVRALSLSLAYGLRNCMPLGKRVARGDTVLVFSPNSLAWTVGAFGLIANGSRLTPANAGYTPAELLHQYTDSGAHAVFVHPSLIGVALEMFALLGLPDVEASSRLIVLELDGDDRTIIPGVNDILSMRDLLGKGSLEREESFDAEMADETVLLCYSSGTTGKPKGVETTHFNFTSELSITEGVMHVYKGQDVMLATLPFYHIYGVNKLLSYPLLIGVPVVIMSKYHPNDFCQAIERYGVTAACVVPPIVLALAYHPSTSNYNVSSLNYLHSAAAPLSHESMDAAIDRLAAAGATVTIGQGYGMTEMSPNTHMTPKGVAHKMRGSVGKLEANLEARLVVAEGEDGEALEDAPLGGPGELWIRGPVVMKGYLHNEAATRNTITKSGWLKTGDIATVDEEGLWRIVDRKKELIKYKGFQVPPAELEGLLLQHPDIVDAAVIGIDEPKQATELPRAYVVHKDGVQGASSTFSLEVQKWIAGRVANHKFLRGGVVVLDTIPKSQAGKILRRQLRDIAKAELAGAQ